jgi:hypothetical protein
MKSRLILLAAILAGACGKSATPAQHALQITTVNLPDGKVGTPYSAKIAATGGVSPYHFALASGSALPSGLVLADDGTISGTPTQAGSSRFEVTATDSAKPARSVSGTILLAIDPLNGEALQVTTTMLPMGHVGQTYTATLSATGGTKPYVWSIGSGSLPAGFALSTDGRVTGTATAAGTSSFSVEVSDASNPAQAAIAALTITIVPGQGSALTITTTNLPSGTIGTAYSAQLTAIGGETPYAWSTASGTSLPSGLTLASNGAISGTPMQAGTTIFSVVVTDSSMPAQMATAQLTIVIATQSGQKPLSITTDALPSATVGGAYMATITATGGATPYKFSIASGALPPGLSLSAQGSISGTPSQAGSFPISVQCTDNSMPAQVATRPLSITVATSGTNNPLTITTVSLPNATEGTAYSAQLDASGGTTPYQWAVDPGSNLPPGLSLSASGRISGTPTTPGRYVFTLVVADASAHQETASKPLSLYVAGPPGSTLTIVTTNLPDATVGAPYRVPLFAIGGAPPYTWSVAAGSLPPGIQLSAMGQLSGTATVAGNYDFNAEVTDSSMPAQRSQASLRITALPQGTRVLTIQTNALPIGVEGRSYASQLQATGGTTPYQWSVAQGALPPGLVLTSTGAVAGVPSSAGSFSFTAQATDSGSPQQTAQRRIAVVIFANMGGGFTIANQFLPNGDVGTPYLAQIFITGGTMPYHLSVSSGALPDGLMLSAASFTLSGTPTTVGSFTFTLLATDSAMPPHSTQRTYTIAINTGGGVRITTFNLPNANVGTTYTATLTAARGTPPYTWAVSMGMLPAGLTLSSAGVIHGDPTQRGRALFVVQVTDSGTPPTSAQRVFSINAR